MHRRLLALLVSWGIVIIMIIKEHQSSYSSHSSSRGERGNLFAFPCLSAMLIHGLGWSQDFCSIHGFRRSKRVWMWSIDIYI